jgi:hypothetical protein
MLKIGGSNLPVVPLGDPRAMRVGRPLQTGCNHGSNSGSDWLQAATNSIRAAVTSTVVPLARNSQANLQHDIGAFFSVRDWY